LTQTVTANELSADFDVLPPLNEDGNMNINRNKQAEVLNNSVDGNLNIKENSNCSHSDNSASGKLKIKKCTEV